MKLAALGGVTIVLGLVLSEPGLLAIGVFWVLLGPLMRAHGQKLLALKGATEQPVIDGRIFATGTLLWVVLGVPSLVVGLLELGISSEHAAWRWLPVVVGGLALGIGALGAVMWGVGSGLSAHASSSPQPTVPATVRVRSVKETGTFINERPRLEFELLVEPGPGSGLASYTVTKRATVPYTALGSIGVGDGFAALVAGPGNPTAMEIHWDQPAAQPGAPAPVDDVSVRLAELDGLHRAGQVSDDEYRTQRERILGTL